MKQNLTGKINECLGILVEQRDKLPKSVCERCVQQINAIADYRQKCANAQDMLESCLDTNKLRNEGKVSSMPCFSPPSNRI